MSASMVRAVLDSSIKPLGTRMVAMALAYHMNEQSGEAWPSHGTLAAECGIHRDSVRHALKQLVRDGVLQVAAKGSGGGHRATTRWAFHPDWLALTGGRGTPGSREPGVEKYADRGSRGPLPGVEGPPKRDERKPTVSLSSKDAREAEPGQAPAGRPSLTAVATTAASQQATKPNSQTPLTRENGQSQNTAWRSTTQGIIDRGVALGLPFTVQEAEHGPPDKWRAYQVSVFRADAFRIAGRGTQRTAR